MSQASSAFTSVAVLAAFASSASFAWADGLPGMQLIRGGQFKKDEVADFYIDHTEVTVARYKACVKAGVCRAPLYDNAKFDWAFNYDKPERGLHPMNAVSFMDAKVFCAWEGKRLPTPNEWGWTAGSGDGLTFPWGEDAPDESRVNACDPSCAEAVKRSLGETMPPMYRGADGYTGTGPIARFPKGATAAGVFDLAGNVAEWADSVEKGKACVFGGSWISYNPKSLAPKEHEHEEIGTRSPSIGFRCAMNVSQSEKSAPGAAPTAAHATAVATAVATAERIAESGPVTISFASGATTLSASQLLTLKKLKARIFLFPVITQVRIEGHTDNQLDDAASLELSGKRAQVVKSQLAGKIISTDRFVAIGFGKSLPVADNSNARGRAMNNRVEIDITEIDGKPVSGKQPTEGGAVFP